MSYLPIARCGGHIAINLFWHAKYNRDPGNMWIRQLFVELFADGKAG